MTRIDSSFANTLLNRLEDLELPLLSWGVASGALAEAEVLDVIDQVLTTHPNPPPGLSAEEVLEQFRDLGLLFRIPGSSPLRYRTRLAETLRLTTGLRQLFAPRDWAREAPPGWWQRQKRLVADYRLHVAPRRYPQRDITAPVALNELESLKHWGPFQHRVAAALLEGLCLARFQVDAARVVFESLHSNSSSKGVIVGAGTGSGKTLAFYLPAFAAMAELTRNRPAGVHTLALYPRTELLRDQLREVVRTIEKVEGALRQEGVRPLRIGVLYGDTPWTGRGWQVDGASRTSGAWRRKRDGVVCPYFTCPHCDTGELLWPDDDRRAGKDSKEVLTCLTCGHVIKEGLVALTRESLCSAPPDLLFTTTEMLNLYGANPRLEGLLGWRGNTAPSLVLLDEVHTYCGLHGAQVALLLRRWRHVVRKRMTFVGLSATLRDADRFFADLVGLRTSDVDSIEPAAECLEPEGREYALALRGDPVAGASLLSTSIQTAMLFGRVLDIERDSFLFGSTGFLFTDDLDVTNRFYDDLRDAEGGQSRTGGRTARRPVLAGLRAVARPEHDARYRDGQSWDLVEKIGHDLDPDLRCGELRIGRTSSQDAGVDRDADLTVATASLEVGFNDPRVGLVLQHKAPRDPAAFLQRRGRAGRQRGTRPITVVALSDYGRDRLAYQAYETLFAPEITARRLPVNNRFVLKIQATQTLLDWLGRKLRSNRVLADPRRVLAAPKNALQPEDEPACKVLVELLNALLEDPTTQDDLARHLRSALQVSADEAQALLWEQPRSLLLSVVPTALRRLRSGWKPLRDDPGATPGALLPEYITKSLFAPLNLPEVELALPFDSDDGVERMPVAHALREAVPGRVSRRFGYRRDEHRTWLPLPGRGIDDLELTQIVSHGIPEGLWHPLEYAPEGVDVVRPLQLRLEVPPNNVATRSQGIPQWGTEIVIAADTPPNPADLPDPSSWRCRLASVGFATHAAGNPIEVRRMATGALCDIGYEGGGSERRTVRYTLRGHSAALGFRLDVDAMQIVINPLDLDDATIQDYLTSPQWRSLAFTSTVIEDAELANTANAFQREWLAGVYLTAFALAGIDGDGGGGAAYATLADGSWRHDLPRIFQVLYRESETAEAAHAIGEDRLVVALTELARDPAVIDALNRAARILVAPDMAARTADLAQRAYRDTLASGILAAAMRACPHAQDDDLIVDVRPGNGPGFPAVVWLTETSVGGLGVVEHLAGHYARDPRAFWGLVDSSLSSSEHEYIDASITRLLRHVTTESSGTAARAMAKLRQAGSAGEADQALHDLRRAWGELDGPPKHAAVAALSTRLLRPGSGPDTDEAALALVDAWTRLEQRLGIEVDARIVAYAVGSDRLMLNGARRLTADQAFSLLWLRGRQARTQHLQHYQPYASTPTLDRLLVDAAHYDRVLEIDVTAVDWAAHYQEAMAGNAEVDLVGHVGDSRSLAAALVRVPVLPVDRDVLRVYGEIRGIARRGDEVRARVDLREAVQ